MNITRALKEPHLLPHRLWRRLYQLRHPDHPWLAPGAIAYLDEHLAPPMIGLEWGSGRSTVWFAKRLGRLISVEHHHGWHAKVREMLDAAAVTNVDQRLIDVPVDPQEQAALLWNNSPYIAVLDELEDGSLDFALVDGLFRQECVARVLPKIRPGGLLAIDQAAHLGELEHWGVPREWEMVFRHKHPRLDTSIWRRPS